jgi:hypothetical protein
VVVEAASILPVHVLAAPFAVFQALVYGHRATRLPPGLAGHARDRGVIQTAAVPYRRSAIPLETAGLSHVEEVDVGQFWAVYVVLGEKTPPALADG